MGDFLLLIYSFISANTAVNSPESFGFLLVVMNFLIVPNLRFFPYWFLCHNLYSYFLVIEKFTQKTLHCSLKSAYIYTPILSWPRPFWWRKLHWSVKTIYAKPSVVFIVANPGLQTYISNISYRTAVEYFFFILSAIFTCIGTIFCRGIFSIKQTNVI